MVEGLLAGGRAELQAGAWLEADCGSCECRRGFERLRSSRWSDRRGWLGPCAHIHHRLLGGGHEGEGPNAPPALVIY